MRKIEALILIVILLGGFLVRLYRFDNPVADWHSFRQSDTNAVSAIFVRDGIDFLYPRYFDISNVQSGMDNPNGYRFVEFPIYNVLQAGLFGMFGGLGGLGITLEEWGRLISIFATLGGATFTFLLTKKYAGKIAGYFAAFFYLFLPFSIFYGRTILPDPAMTSAILAGIYFFDKWIENSSKFKVQSSKLQFKVKSYFILSIALTALSFLLKPFALFFTLPMIYLAWRHFGFSFVKKWQMWLFTVLTLAPLLLWRWWIGHFPEGIPASDWLFNGDGIRFRPAFFRWIFFERITKLILGYGGVIFFVIGGIGVIREIGGTGRRSAGFFLSFAVASLLYVVVMATGNVRHDYYQILIIPTVSMLGGLGVLGVFLWLGKFGRLGSPSTSLRVKLGAPLVCLLLIITAFWLSWVQVRDYFNINDRGMVEAGLKAKEILPKDAIVIAPHDGSTTFLNLIKRPGWSVFQSPIEELIDKGATHLVIANPTQSDFDGFGEMYTPVASSSAYLILKLK